MSALGWSRRDERGAGSRKAALAEGRSQVAGGTVGRPLRSKSAPVAAIAEPGALPSTTLALVRSRGSCVPDWDLVEYALCPGRATLVGILMGG